MPSSLPWVALCERIQAALAAAEQAVAVVVGPRSTVVPDAIVVRPAEPWISRGAAGRPARFTSHLERYAAVCAVRVADADSALVRLYAMARAVLAAAAADGWDWETTGAVQLDATTDTPLLVVVVALTYQA